MLKPSVVPGERSKLQVYYLTLKQGGQTWFYHKYFRSKEFADTIASKLYAKNGYAPAHWLVVPPMERDPEDQAFMDAQILSLIEQADNDAAIAERCAGG